MQYHYVLPTLFQDIAQNQADNIAIKYKEDSYSYQAVDVDSSLVAQHLLDNDVKRGDVIAIINSKQYISYVIMLACLKIGATYTNIDPDAPAEWFSNIISVCKPTIIFADDCVKQNILDGSQLCNTDVIEAVALLDLLKQTKSVVPAELHPFDGNTIAYIMFTSGSTGKPKGVAITHQSLIHFINWTINRYQIKANDVFANVSPMYFDNSVFDFYSALFSGACLVPINKTIVASPKLLVNYVDEMACTIWFSVPSLLIYLMTTKVLNKQSFSQVRMITFGGEGYPKPELKKLYNMFADRITIINVYGPTECTCICSSYLVTDKDFADLTTLCSLGEINPNISYLILNEEGQKASKGELCLLGPNVAVGYYNDLERTASAFFHYTGNGYFQAKMYRTGDLVQEQDELLYFIGRKDNQIKHMGYRIELEAIELAISKIDRVNEVAVVYQRRESAFGKILAFIASADDNLTSTEIKEKLKSVLPEYMLPNQCVFLNVLPKNANGKIDRKNLLNVLESNLNVA